MSAQYKTAHCFFFVFAILGLVACKPNSTQKLPISNPGYILAGSNLSEGFRYNALTIFDLQNPNGQALNVDLLKSWAYNFDLAPNGSIWIGYSGEDIQSNDNRIQVYSPEDNSVKTIETCMNPRAGIKFVNNKAFVGCAATGFSGLVQVIDLKSQKVIKEIELKLEGKQLLLVSSGANLSKVIFSAMTSGSDPNKGYSSLAMIDANTFESQIHELGPDTDIWAVIPYKNKFILLNSESFYSKDTPRRDVLIFDPEHPTDIKYLQLAISSPVWGQIDKDTLFAYHNASWNSLNDEVQRSITKTNLLTGESISFSLPDKFDADSLTIWNGAPCLTHSNYFESKEKHGIYCLDNTGKLELKISTPYASGFMIP
jgi:hypothetical protein